MNDAHLRAAFPMLAGENVAAVSARSGICCTSFYKLRRRRRRAATDAVRREIEHTTKRIRVSGLMYFNGRRVYISPGLLAGEKIKIFETLNGLEAEDGGLYFLPDYKTKICRPLRHYSDGAWQEDVSKSAGKFSR